jgi:hypothetical protein
MIFAQAHKGMNLISNAQFICVYLNLFNKSKGYLCIAWQQSDRVLHYQSQIAFHWFHDVANLIFASAF